jgi:hypothetical protein
MTIAVLAYCTTAEASNELRMKETSSPESLRSWEGDRSNMDLEERGDFHSYEDEDGTEGLGDGLGGAGRKDQAEEGSLYKSLREAGVFMVYSGGGCYSSGVTLISNLVVIYLLQSVAPLFYLILFTSCTHLHVQQGAPDTAILNFNFHGTSNVTAWVPISWQTTHS